MIVPEHWAEARVQHREPRKQVTVRRFGWSDQSIAEAQNMADARAREALQRIIEGAPSDRREPKVPYNGAEGVPIREEIVSRHGDEVITRNSYGARCLNTPDVMFVDVDLPDGQSCALSAVVTVALVIAALVWGSNSGSKLLGIGLVICALFSGHYVTCLFLNLALRLRGGAEKIARDRVKKFVMGRPDWNVRIYRTPSGLRVLALHRAFDPDDPEALECFKALAADPVYVRMCRNQKCFRARLSAKPWRLGIARHIISGRVAWPPKPDRLPARSAWIEHYESAANGYAACAWITDLGSGGVSPEVRPVMELHDRESKALTGLPIA
jgi:hypothetical protein